MKVKFYLYYVEVSRFGNASDIVWKGSGTAETNNTPDKLFNDISSRIKDHVSKTMTISEHNLCVIIKQFNPL